MSAPTITSPAFIKGYVGTEAVFGLGGPTTPGTPSTAFTAVGGIIDVKGDGPKRNIVTVTDLSSALVRRIAGTLDYQTVKIDLKNNASDAGQALATTALLSGEAYDFVAQYTDPGAALVITVTGSGIVTDFGGYDLEDDKVNQSSLTISIDGATTTTTAAVA